MELEEKNHLNFTKKIVPFLICLLILSTQGIIVYKIFEYIELPFLKNIITELITILLLFLVIIDFIITKREVATKYLGLLFFLITINAVMIIRVGDVADVSYAFREVSLIFVNVFIVFYLRRIIISTFQKYTAILLILNIFNLIFTLYSFKIGSAAYSKLIEGQTFYAISYETGFKISHINGLLRSPALIGDATNYGYFSFLSLIVFLSTNKKWSSLIAFINIVLCFTRSVYLVTILFAIVLFLYNVYTNKNRNKALIIGVVGVAITSLATIFLNPYISKLITSNSSIERIKNWDIILNTVDFNWVNFFFGGFYGFIGSANKYYDSFFNTFDNSLLFYFYNIGFVGMSILVIYILIFISLYPKTILIIIPFFFSMFFINITQSHIFLNVFPLAMLAITLYAKKDSAETYH